MSTPTAPEGAPVFAPFVPPVVPREWGLMVVRALLALGLAIALVTVTVAVATPNATPWKVSVNGHASVASLATATHLCSTVGATRTLGEETYRLGAAIPTTESEATAWATNATVVPGPTRPAVVCVFHTMRSKYGAEILVPDVVTVIAGFRSIQTYYLSSVPVRAITESTIPAEGVWF